MVFSEGARKEFLTGFRRRKDERRKKAQEEIETRLKEEIKKIKSETKDKVNLNSDLNQKQKIRFNSDLNRFMLF